MKLLYSDILPLSLPDERQTIADSFRESFTKSNRVDIAVGYVSRASLEELAKLVEEYGVSTVSLIIGMYYYDGMPESTFHAAMEVNEKWTSLGIGEVRIVRSFKYHGKIYCFFSNDIPFSAIVGSANLGVIKTDASNRRQYEVSAVTSDITECTEIADIINRLKRPDCSTNIADIKDMPLIREMNVSLTGIDTVSQLPPSSIQLYRQHKTTVSFVLPIKVPCFNERHMDDGRHYTKSNINVCYAAPRNKRKSRDWYETQMTVSNAITRLDGYPEKNKDFYVVTDDGYCFKAHTTSDGNKQFSAVGDELILGRWIKGRIAAAGLVRPSNDTQADIDRMGMITREMLNAYGCNSLVLTKTDQRALDEEGAELDVWILSFENVQVTDD